jgi:hypothetical protein
MILFPSNLARSSPPTCSAIVVWLALVPGSVAQTRDTLATVPVATGSISGVVVADDADARPLRRARVTLNSPDQRIRRTVMTDTDGMFVFRPLPAGRYMLAASKEAYVPLVYGAKRYNAMGAAIVLDRDEQVTNIVVKLPRGGVITGALLDHSGQPLSGVAVRAMRYAFINGGERRLMSAGAPTSGSDDRGVYRLFALPAGDYVVAAFPRTGGGQSTVPDVRVISDAEMRRALVELTEDPSATQRTPRGTTTTAGAADSSESGPAVGYAPVFYPGTAVAAQATLVTVKPGEERTGVDFQCQLVRMAKVNGTVAVPEGVQVESVWVTMTATGQLALPAVLLDSVRSARPGADGEFAFGGVPPGQYTIVARGAAKTRVSVRSRSPSFAWAITNVSIEGEDISGLRLQLQPGLSLTGRLAFDGTRLRPPADLSRVRVIATPVQSATDVSFGVASAQADANGTFTVVGLMPARYRLTATIAGNPLDGSGWTLASSLANGRDALDVPLDLSQDVEGILITFTDRAAEVTGSVVDARGQAAPEYTVVVFAKDNAFWLPQSRRVVLTRPASNGTYRVRGLPPGNYLVALVLDPEPGRTSDPSSLRQLAASAIPLTLAEGDKKRQDVRVAPGPLPQ